MEHSHQRRDSKGELRDVAGRWVAKIRIYGQTPNRDVMFGPDEPSDQTTPAQGFLLTDGSSEDGGYLVLEDGDVLSMQELCWMSGPCDELVAILGRSITDAMYRRQGHFAEGREVQWVPERRVAHSEVQWVPERRVAHPSHGVPDRRNYG